MNKALQILALVIGIFSTTTTSLQAQTPVTDTVLMGPSYANEVYYSMANGTVASFPRNSWDIAFRTRILSSSILTNDGRGVILYTYPVADTSGWNSFDTTGLFQWTPMFNDVNDWENGAFMRNATGGFDFGWGVYNQTTHFLTGDSLFVIQLRDGSFRKLWIQQKKSGLNTYYFKYANLDGTGENTITLDCNPYTAKDFIGFSLQTNEVVDFQPAKTTWDLVFTKYMSIQPNGMPYPVTGVLQNDGVKAEKFKHVSPLFIGYNPNEWDSTRAVIGSDWKMFDGAMYQVVDSLVNFVKTKTGEVYKIVFTEFAGSSTGLIAFETSKLAGVGMKEVNNANATVVVYPNPATENVNVYFTEKSPLTRTIALLDMSGRTLFVREVGGGESRVVIPASSLNSGIYLLQVKTGNESVTKKVILSK
jgi:hypothetical protein